MNNDLAGDSAVWRALLGVHGGRLCCFICVTSRPFVKEPPKLFAMDDGSVSGDGHRFRCCTVGELLRDSDWVSVIAVREKCDVKCLRADQGHRSVRCRQLGRAPLRLCSGLRQNRAGFLEKREKGRTASYFRYCQKN